MCWFNAGETGMQLSSLIRKLPRIQGFAPKMLVTDKLCSYGAAFHYIGLACHHERELRKNNRAENSHQVV